MYIGCCLVEKVWVSGVAVILTWFFSLSLSGQNLVPNPSFEEYLECPMTLTPQGGTLSCIPWISPTNGTPDFLHECGSGGAGVPWNINGNQAAHSGSGYGGFVVFVSSLEDRREYLEVQLTEPLQAGVTYLVSFYYSLGDYSCPVGRLGLYLSDEQINEIGNPFELNYQPQIEFGPGLIENKETWDLVERCYVAQGGEEWIVIGNFYSDAETPIGEPCSAVQLSYIYIDDVSVIEGPPEGELEFTLGPDLIVCDTVEITVPVSGYYTWQDNTHLQTYTVTESGTYHVLVAEGCNFGMDTIEVTVVEPIAPIELGPSMTDLCVGDELIYSFDPDLGDFLWQDNSTSPTYVISSPGTYSVTLSNLCGSSVDVIEVLTLDIPVLPAFPVDTILCPGETLILSLDPELGEFLWQDGSTGASFEIGESGSYSVTVSNMCGESSTDINVSYTDFPVVFFDEDTLLICPGEQILLSLNANVGEYVWQDGWVGANYVVAGPGTYQVTVTNMCGSDVASITVLAGGLPDVDLGADLSICSGESVILAVGSAAGTYVWSDGSTGASFETDTAGIVWVSVTSACGTSSDSIEISILQNVSDPGLPEALGLCDGESVLVGTGIDAQSFLWSTGSDSASTLITAPGLYFLTVTGMCGVTVDSVIVTNLDSLPLVDLGPDITLCAGDAYVLSPGLPGVYTWNDGSNGTIYEVSGPGIVYVTIDNACGSTSDTLLVTQLDAIAELDLGPDTSICPGEMVLLDPGIANVQFTWSDGSSGATFTTATAGEVVLEISNLCGTARDTVEILLLPDLPILNLGADFSICPGEMTVLSPGYPDVSYLWNDGSTDATYDVNGAGEIILTISNACGSSTDTIVVTEDANGPILDLGPDISVCEGETVTISPGVNGVQYLWQDGSTGNSFSATQSASVILQVSNGCGIARDTLIVTIAGTAPLVDLGPDLLLCDDDTVVLNVDNQVTITWHDGSSDANYVVSAAGVYSVELMNACGSAYDTILVSHEDSPAAFDLGPDQTLCAGETVALLSPSLPAGSTRLWNTGSSEDTLTVGGGTYALLISNVCGSVSDTVAIEELTEALAQPQPLESEICPGESVLLDAGQTVTAEYLWSTGEQSPSIEAVATGVYSVTVTSACDALSAELEVLEGDCSSTSVYIPNVFSPNGDGVNDGFRIELDPAGLTDFTMQIFDRWGERVYVSDSPEFAWDGQFLGKPLQPGVYVYYIRLTFAGRRPRILSGDVTLIR